MGRILLLAGLVLAACVGLGLLLRSFKMAPVAQPEVIEMLMQEEVALLHEIAEELAARDLDSPRFDHDQGIDEFRRLQDEFLEDLNRVTAPAAALEHPGILGIKVKVKTRRDTRLEAWVISPEGGTDIYGFTRFNQNRPEIGRAVVAHAEVQGKPAAAYRAMGPEVDGKIPSFELLVDVAWLEAQAGATMFNTSSSAQ